MVVRNLPILGGHLPYSDSILAANTDVDVDVDVDADAAAELSNWVS